MAPLLQDFSGERDGGIAGKDKFDENRSQNVRIHGSLSNNSISKDKDTRLIGLSYHIKGEITINNTSTSSNDSIVKPLMEKHDITEEHYVSDRNVVQGFALVNSQQNGATTKG